MRALQIIIASICWVLAMCGEFASKCLTTGSLRKKKKPSYTVFADFHGVNSDCHRSQFQATKMIHVECWEMMYSISII